MRFTEAMHFNPLLFLNFIVDSGRWTQNADTSRVMLAQHVQLEAHTDYYVGIFMYSEIFHPVLQCSNSS